MVIWVSYDIYIYIYTSRLVGGLEHGFYFSIYWECHHPNWLIVFRGVETTNQYGSKHCLRRYKKNLQIIVNYTPNTSWEGTWIHRVYIYIIIQVYIHIGISDICILYKWYGMILFNILFFWIQERGIPFLTNQRGILNTAQVLLIGDDHNSVVGVRLWLWNNGFDR